MLNSSVTPVGYSSNVSPAGTQGGATSTTQVPGLWVEEDEYLVPASFCSVIRDDGNHCKARPAKGTEYCIGHLRSAEKSAESDVL